MTARVVRCMPTYTVAISSDKNGHLSNAAWSAEKFASPSPRKVFGLIGLPRLLLSSHLVVVTAREQARPAVQVTDLAALRRYFRQHIPVNALLFLDIHG